MAHCFNICNIILLLCLLIEIFLGIEIPFKIVDDYSENSNKKLVESPLLIRHLNQHTFKLERRNKLYFIKVNIGNPGQDYVLKLSTLFQGVSLIDKTKNREGYNSTTSDTFTQIKENHTNFLGWGVISSDTLRVAPLGVEIEKVPFFLVKKTHYAATLYQGVFGIAYDTEDQVEDNDKSAFDFIGYLPKIKAEYSSMIGLRAVNKSEGVMSIGELPEEIKAHIKLYHKCPLLSIQNNHSWSCRLNAIFFKDLFFYQINAKIDFTLGGSTMSVPQDLFSLMIDRYFKAEFENGTCFFDDEYIYNRFKQIVCQNSYDIKEMGLISFVFGKWTLKINSEKLFHYSRDSYYFSIVYDNDGDDHLFMSPILLSDYYFIFDKGNKQLGFYKVR